MIVTNLEKARQAMAIILSEFANICPTDDWLAVYHTVGPQVRIIERIAVECDIMEEQQKDESSTSLQSPSLA